MNPTVPQSVIDEAMEAEPVSATAAYGARFRTDVETYICPRVGDAAVLPGRFELPPLRGTNYIAFVEPSGGTSDSMTLAIAHREKDGRVLLDAVCEWSSHKGAAGREAGPGGPPACHQPRRRCAPQDRGPARRPTRAAAEAAKKQRAADMATADRGRDAAAG
jgi:hypothetical protein